MDANQMKDGVTEGKNRPVLGDIGNILAIRGVDGQPAPEICNPATGTLFTQSLSPAQTAAVAENNEAVIGLSNEPNGHIIDTDASDVSSNLAAVEYVEEIYDFYKRTESHSQVGDYMDSQLEIDDYMRAILVDWLIQVHCCFKLEQEALYLAISIVDRFLSVQTVKQRELQLVGMSAMFMASKYEKKPCAWPLQVSELIYVSAYSYNREQILTMEKDILIKLKWNLTFPTPYVFLIRFIMVSIPDEQMEHTTHFFAELGVTYYVTVMNCPSMLAAAAVYAARCTLRKSPAWDGTLEYYTGYSEKQLLDCAKLLIGFHASAAEGELKLFEKYSQPERSRVALLPPAIWCL